MFAHIIKLIWNRKGANFLIITEVAITFIVLFAITSTALHNYQKFNQPLGFNWQNTWSVTLNTGGRWKNEKDTPQLKELVNALRQRSEIASVDLSAVPVFENWTHSSITEINQKNTFHLSNRVNDEGPKSWGVKLIAGRWFGEQDDGQNYVPVMVNQLFVDKAFDGEPPINYEYNPEDYEGQLPRRIVGVFEDFRQRGEFSDPVPYLFNRYTYEVGGNIHNIQLKFAQTKTAAYEETLLKVLKGIAPNWEFEIKSWKSKRESHIKEVLLPLIITSVVVGFLLIMVAMGLFGVLWQNISRRTQEIGLRRAIGASKSSIQTQIISELLVVALFGITIAFMILIQAPLLELVEWVTWANFWLSFGASVSVILVMVILCALYPSRTAIRIAPALALHYE